MSPFHWYVDSEDMMASQACFYVFPINASENFLNTKFSSNLQGQAQKMDDRWHWE